MNKFYITSAIPYVNGKPHIGHALEYFQADTVKRFHQLLGEETLLLSGADENALKNVQAAEKEGTETQAFLDKNSQVFKDAFKTLGVELDIFQRGSDKEKHWPGVQKLWQLCLDNEDIYKKSYEGLYCVGCESFKIESELTPDGLCPDHLKKPDLVKEENYFFKLSKYQQQIIDLIESNTLKVVPENKRQETLSFIKSGLEDFSVSRSVTRARGIGVPVPNDDTQVMYVWFDALTIYMTGIGFGTDEEMWKKWWPADVHVIGKDINRFHTVYWPAMLLSASLPLPKTILIHDFIISGGQKMSKTLGNVINPFDMIDQFGLEPFRYFLLSQMPINDTGDFTVERFKEVFQANLANGLGNLVARLAKLAENNAITLEDRPLSIDSEITSALETYNFSLALESQWKAITILDKKLNDSKPWTLSPSEATPILIEIAYGIRMIAYNLMPFMPETAKRILEQFSGEIKAQSPLFPRIS